MLRFIGALVVIAVIVLGIGHFAGWFSLTSTTQAGTTKIGFDVHGDEIKEDAQRMKEKVSGMVDRIKGDALLTGEVRAVDRETRRLDLAVDGGETQVLVLPKGIEVVIDGEKAGLGKVVAGDEAVVHLEREGELDSARKVVIVRNR